MGFRGLWVPGAEKAVWGGVRPVQFQFCFRVHHMCDLGPLHSLAGLIYKMGSRMVSRYKAAPRRWEEGGWSASLVLAPASAQKSPPTRGSGTCDGSEIPPPPGALISGLDS